MVDPNAWLPDGWHVDSATGWCEAHNEKATWKAVHKDGFEILGCDDESCVGLVTLLVKVYMVGLDVLKAWRRTAEAMAKLNESLKKFNKAALHVSDKIAVEDLLDTLHYDWESVEKLLKLMEDEDG